MGFEKIETQEELDLIIKERLARQKESIEKQYEDYENLKTKIAELEAENVTLQTTISESANLKETHQAELDNLNNKIAGYETANLKTKIALKNGIPLELAERLSGSNEDEIQEDAKRLSAFVKSKATEPPLKNTEPIIEDSENQSWKDMIKNLSE